VNDVTALADPEMAATCAAAGAAVVLMHMQGSPQSMQDRPGYGDVLTEVGAYLAGRGQAAADAGITPDRICIDPGIGFGKTVEHNLVLLGNLGVLAGIGFPVLVGTSRKRFIGEVMERAGFRLDPAQRDVATGATVAAAIAGGASVVRVHDVAGALQVARMADAIVRAGR
jgi:dihydropteroate synthase